jgi:hypothetical protein
VAISHGDGILWGFYFVVVIVMALGTIKSMDQEPELTEEDLQWIRWCDYRAQIERQIKPKRKKRRR